MLKSDLPPKLFWLWLPILVLIAQIMLAICLPSEVLAKLLSEGGPHEIVEFLVMGAAFLIALSILLRIDWKTQKILAAWVALFALGSFYITGEEVSWGQHLLKWSTPELWSQINDQNETNLHNTSSWLDQKPRIILQLGILVGGLIIPFLRRFKPFALPKRLDIIYPPSVLAVTALLALAVNMLDRVDSSLKDIVIFERASEVEELYMFWFVLLYLMALRRRVLQHKS